MLKIWYNKYYVLKYFNIVSNIKQRKIIHILMTYVLVVLKLMRSLFF